MQRDISPDAGKMQRKLKTKLNKMFISIKNTYPRPKNLGLRAVLVQVWHRCPNWRVDFSHKRVWVAFADHAPGCVLRYCAASSQCCLQMIPCHCAALWPPLAQMLSSKQFLNKRKKRSPAQIKQLLHARQQIKATEKENHGLKAKSLPSRTTRTETRGASVLASIKSRLNEAVEKLSVCTLEVHQQNGGDDREWISHALERCVNWSGQSPSTARSSGAKEIYFEKQASSCQRNHRIYCS